MREKRCWCWQGKQQEVFRLWLLKKKSWPLMCPDIILSENRKPFHCPALALMYMVKYVNRSGGFKILEQQPQTHQPSRLMACTKKEQAAFNWLIVNH